MHAGYVKRIALVEVLGWAALFSTGVGVATALLSGASMKYSGPFHWSWSWYWGGALFAVLLYSLFQGWLWTMEMHRTDCLEGIKAGFPNEEVGEREIRKWILVTLFGNPLTWPIGLAAKLVMGFVGLIGRDWRISVPICAALAGVARSQLNNNPTLAQIGIYAAIGALLGLFLVPDIRRKFLF